MRRGALATLLALALLAPARGSAQVCWWRTSLERCKVIVLTETSISYPLLNTHADKLLPGIEPGDSMPLGIDAFHSELGWELGALYVLDARTAVGATAARSVGFGEGESALRLSLRGRRQLTKSIALEANLGTIEGHAGNSNDRYYPAGRKQGATVQLRANFEELLLVGVRYDQLPWRDNGPEQRDRYPLGSGRALSGVIAVGAKPAVPINVALALGLVALNLIFAGWAG